MNLAFNIPVGMMQIFQHPLPKNMALLGHIYRIFLCLRTEKSSVSVQPLKGMSYRGEYESCLGESGSQQLAGESLLQVPQGKRVLNFGRKREKGKGWEPPFPHRVGGLPPRRLLHPHLSLLSLMELGQPPLDPGKSLFLEAKGTVFVPRAPMAPSPLQPGSARLLGSTGAKLNRIALFPL